MNRNHPDATGLPLLSLKGSDKIAQGNALGSQAGLHAMRRRSAFTLVEILVVIAIIGILTALLAGGVMTLMRKGPETYTRNDILQLSTALQKFHTKFGFYPPNKIHLRSNYADYTNVAPDPQSVAIISTMWPNLTGKTAGGVPYWQGINWGNRTGAGTPVYGAVAPRKDDTLDGDQCLVFFLGGIPNSAGGAPLGFSLDPTNPAALPTAAAPDRLKFLDFDGGRIQMMTAVHAGTVFPSYLDAYKKQPFIYFSSGQLAKRANGYDPTANAFNVLPYIEKAAAGTTPAQYYMPSQFQIISAGLDGKFGAGGTALPTTDPNGKDDMSNFSQNMLGAAP